MFTLHYDAVAKGLPYHAAMVKKGRFSDRFTMHNHDFYELMYIEKEGGTHHVEGEQRRIREGEVILIRPMDCHQVICNTSSCCFINVAFPTTSWHTFCDLVRLEPDHPGHHLSKAPAPTLQLEGAERLRCRRAFLGALEDFQDVGSPIGLCSFFATVARSLTEAGDHFQSALAPTGPEWLRDACLQLATEDSNRMTVADFASVAGVSREHLARSLKGAMGLSPSEYLVMIRLERSARLLRGADMSIIDIALECGFESLSYYYRRFRQRYGVTPLAYRQSRQREILP